MLGCAIVAVVLIAAFGSCVAFLGARFAPATAVVLASHGQIDSFYIEMVGAPSAVRFQAATGVDAEQAAELACEVIKPTLAGTELANASWVLVNRAGDVIASDETDCGP